jgi:hypothetical protein
MCDLADVMFSSKFTSSEISVACSFGRLDSDGRAIRSSLHVGPTDQFYSSLQGLRTSLFYRTHTLITKFNRLIFIVCFVVDLTKLLQL